MKEQHGPSIILNHNCPYATPEELYALRDIAKGLHELAVVVMLGAGPGVMGLAILEGNANVLLTIIDNSNLYYAQTHIARAFPGASVDYIFADSSSVGSRFPCCVDLLIVDADHTLTGVTKDIDAWLPKLAQDGIIFFHDYDASDTPFAAQEQYPGVSLAVDGFLANTSLQFTTERVGTSLIVRRKDE